MKHYTPRELRVAIFVTVVLTLLTVLALLDPSCQGPLPMTHPVHAVSP